MAPSKAIAAVAPSATDLVSHLNALLGAFPDQVEQVAGIEGALRALNAVRDQIAAARQQVGGLAQATANARTALIKWQARQDTGEPVGDDLASARAAYDAAVQRQALAPERLEALAALMDEKSTELSAAFFAYGDAIRPWQQQVQKSCDELDELSAIAAFASKMARFLVDSTGRAETERFTGKGAAPDVLLPPAGVDAQNLAQRAYYQITKV